MNKLYIITGPAGVGKSTISKSLAESLEKSVLIEGDDIYNQFVGGRISPYKENAPLDLFWNNCILLINGYLSNGYDVIFNYIIMKDRLKELTDSFNKYQIKFIVLLTDEETIVKRDKERPKDCQMGERSIILLNQFINENYENNYKLYTTKLTVKDSVDEIINSNRFIVNDFKVYLREPNLDEYWYEQKTLNDSKTMNYNAGFDVKYAGYNYETGCIDFPKERWEEQYNKRKTNNVYFAYIVLKNNNTFVGNIGFKYNTNNGKYECGVVVEAKHKKNGYGKEALQLLLDVAHNDYKVTELYDSFEETRNALPMFKKLGFVKSAEFNIIKFGKKVKAIEIKKSWNNF